MKILNKTRLTSKIIETLPDDVRDEMCLDEEWPNQYYEDQDFVFFSVQDSKGKVFDVVHGFPGDNPFGVVYDDDCIFDLLGSGDSISNSEVEKWYNKITKDATSFYKLDFMIVN